MSRIILATKNRSKYTSVSRLLNSLAQRNCFKIHVQPLDDSIKPPSEDGESSHDIVRSKAQYYVKFLNDPFVVIDDEINLSSLFSNLAFHEFHSLGDKYNKTNEELVAKLLSSAVINRKYPISIIRHFGCITKNRKMFFKNIYECYLKINNDDAQYLQKKKLNDNPLNNFMYTIDDRKLLSISDRSDIIYSQSIKAKLLKFIVELKNY